jgi:uncharacterized repeat protein (TIGR03837 family)
MSHQNTSCDIFCNVIDNYGDIGVCWRLARQLANEHGIAVRLWVDDVASFAKLCPEADATLESQMQRGVDVCVWRKDFPDAQPADIVIEAFGCKLPESYVAAMTAQEHPPVWINLEYLSAESWVEGCHKLPSPHPRLPLTKYFFVPGFTPQTGGLLLERDLLDRRDVFLNNVVAQQDFWRGIGMDMPAADTLKISLFAYENNALPALFDAWANGAQAVLCLVPTGRILPQVEQYFQDACGNPSLHAPDVGIHPDQQNYARGNLQVRVLPFVAQEDYDTLLWACDVNFVRGEDSCVRAQWAGKPFVWQIYPQHDEVHWEKLQAFLDVYGASLSDPANHSLHTLWKAWNASTGSAQVASPQSLVLSGVEGWTEFAALRQELDRHALDWARLLAKNDLALNLLDFCQKVGKIRAFKMEGQ